MSVRLSHKANQVVYHVCPSVTQSQSSCFSCLSVCHILSFAYLAYIYVCPSVTQSQSSCLSCLSVCHTKPIRLFIMSVRLSHKANQVVFHVGPSVTQSQSSCFSCLSFCHILSFVYLAYIHVCPSVTQSQSSCLSCLSVCHTKPIKLFFMSVCLSHT
jgi:hypothetical protein